MQYAEFKDTAFHMQQEFAENKSKNRILYQAVHKLGGGGKKDLIWKIQTMLSPRPEKNV